MSLWELVALCLSAFDPGDSWHCSIWDPNKAISQQENFFDRPELSPPLSPLRFSTPNRVQAPQFNSCFHLTCICACRADVCKVIYCSLSALPHSSCICIRNFRIEFPRPHSACFWSFEIHVSLLTHLVSRQRSALTRCDLVGLLRRKTFGKWLIQRCGIPFLRECKLQRCAHNRTSIN